MAPWERARPFAPLLTRLRRRARRLVVVTAEMRQALVAAGETPERVVVVPNGADLARFPPGGTVRSDFASRPALVGHVGTMGHGQDLDTLVSAASLLPPAPPVQVLLVGEGVRRASLEARAQREAPGRVRFEDARPHAEVPALLQSLDVALVSSRWSARCESTVPAKLYEALACGRPVLLAGRGAAAALLERAGAGRVVPPGDPRCLAEALSAMLADEEARRRYASAGPAFVRTRHDRDALAAHLLEILKEVTDGD